MKVRFWGVRGSVPVPGATTVRYGGNTSCVEVESADGTTVIFDAGTGLRRLGQDLSTQFLNRGRGKAHILISHTHWDHIQGLPFFSPLYQKDNDIHIYARKRDDVRLRSVLAGQASPPFFPVPLEDTRAQVSFHELTDGAGVGLGELRVATAKLNHPNLATAYAVSDGTRKVAYVSDTAPFENILFGDAFIAKPPPLGEPLPQSDLDALTRMRDNLVRLCEGADVVIYDTMFTQADYERVPHFGHSRPTDAMDICHRAGVENLVLFHHAPERDDDALDGMLAEARKTAEIHAPGLNITAAYEGLELNLVRGLHMSNTHGDGPHNAAKGRNR